MSKTKTITIQLQNDKYQLFKKFADMDNRTISNFIETATTRYIEEIEYADEFEMQEIESNKSLKNSIIRGINDSKQGLKRKIG
ncbi:hypothetical protein QUF74_09560 [Candidatus Halobeggiatoa sp. HSG11]|nr:hypothetical protein [Candidatus Halobeggiatoa sp. HSG11]